MINPKSVSQKSNIVSDFIHIEVWPNFLVRYPLLEGGTPVYMRSALFIIMAICGQITLQFFWMDSIESVCREWRYVVK